jgi:hypothetical protein
MAAFEVTIEDHGVRAYFDSQYGVDLGDFLAARSEVDHHDWFRLLSADINQDESAVLAEAARAYVADIAEAERSSLVTLLKESVRR